MNDHGIKKKTDYQHLRLRPNMYLGSIEPHTQSVIEYDNLKPVLTETTWTPAIYTCLREILDNCLDEIVGHGYGNRIDVTYDPINFIFTVRDNGRGIPIDWDDTHQNYLVTMVLTEPRAGRNFDDRGEVAGVNGIGAAAVSNTSSWFRVEVTRDGKLFRQTFKEAFLDDTQLYIGEPEITKSKNDKTGTYIEYTPSKEVYKNILLPESFVRSRITELTVCNPQIKFTYNGEIIKVKPKIEQNLFDNSVVAIEIKDQNFLSRFWIVPDWQASGDSVHSIVNNIPAFNGGVHLESFRRNFYSGLIKSLERESKKRSLTPNQSDVTEGQLLYNVTTMIAPNFDSQSKTRLINEEAGKIIAKYFSDESVFKKIISQNHEWIDAIYTRCAARTQKRDAADLAKANRKLLRTKVPKLLDANGRDRSKCIIFLTEGDSAKAQISSVRDSEIHGALPLRGKVLNVRGETNKDILENSIIADILQSIGLQLGVKADRSNLRYGKVYLAADQDPDGANITALLVNFFYLQWPELFDPKQPAYFYVFQTPFIIQDIGKGRRKYWYASDYTEYRPEDYKGLPHATRAKGLGSLEEVDWIYSLAHPKLVPLLDDDRLAEALKLIFDHNLADMRKKWISLN